MSPRTGRERYGKYRLHRDSIPRPVASGCADYAVVLIWISDLDKGTMLPGSTWLTIATGAEPDRHVNRLDIFWLYEEVLATYFLCGATAHLGSKPPHC